MSNSVQPHRQQPSRLTGPWGSPGKNTGVGCHFLLQCMKVKSESEVAQSYPTFGTPWTAAYQAPPSTGFSRQEYRSGVPLPSLIYLSTYMQIATQISFLKTIHGHFPQRIQIVNMYLQEELHKHVSRILYTHTHIYAIYTGCICLSTYM